MIRSGELENHEDNSLQSYNLPSRFGFGRSTIRIALASLEVSELISQRQGIGIVAIIDVCDGNVCA